MKHLISVTILLLSFTTLFAEKLSDYVVPIKWDDFKEAKASKKFLHSEKIISNAGRYSYIWANNYYASSASNDRFLIPNVNKEQPIRTPSSAALGLAMALRTGIDPLTMGGTYDEITMTITKLVKGVVANHKANGGQWGEHWQSTLWAAQVGRAGWLMWEYLDADTQEMLCKMLVFEADRHIRPDYKIPYWNGIGGNSRAEENSWDSMPLQLAVAMMPTHPHATQWKEICSRMLCGAYSVKADMNKTKPLLDGKSPQEWIKGYNVREDGMVINHNLLHNDYMASIAHLQMSGFIVFSLAQQPVPQTLDYNFDLIYRTLVTKSFDSPPFKAPGGTMYIPGSADQYYPEGTDWSKYRYACYLGLDALADDLKYDKKLPKAENWRKLRVDRILELQSRHENGKMYAPGEYDSYWGVEQMVFWMMADAHMLQWLDDRKAISKQDNWLK